MWIDGSGHRKTARCLVATDPDPADRPTAAAAAIVHIRPRLSGQHVVATSSTTTPTAGTAGSPPCAKGPLRTVSLRRVAAPVSCATPTARNTEHTSIHHLDRRSFEQDRTSRTAPATPIIISAQVVPPATGSRCANTARRDPGAGNGNPHLRNNLDGPSTTSAMARIISHNRPASGSSAAAARTTTKGLGTSITVHRPSCASFCRHASCSIAALTTCRPVAGTAAARLVAELTSILPGASSTRPKTCLRPSCPDSAGKPTGPGTDVGCGP